jgi:hypothetical protein
MESLMTEVVPKASVIMRISEQYLKETLVSNQHIFNDCLQLPIGHGFSPVEEKEIEGISDENIINYITKVIDLIETAQV